jgi:hypothetical protein
MSNPLQGGPPQDRRSLQTTALAVLQLLQHIVSALLAIFGARSTDQ